MAIVKATASDSGEATGVVNGIAKAIEAIVEAITVKAIVNFITGDDFVFILSFFFVVFPFARLFPASQNNVLIFSPPLFLMPIVGLFGIRLALHQKGFPR